MVTFQAGRVVLLSLLASLATACSQEKEDWRSAEAANTTEAWQRFVEQHPDSEFVDQARTRIAQLRRRSSADRRRLPGLPHAPLERQMGRARPYPHRGVLLRVGTAHSATD